MRLPRGGSGTAQTKLLQGNLVLSGFMSSSSPTSPTQLPSPQSLPSSAALRVREFHTGLELELELFVQRLPQVQQPV